jgi:type III pantothenate kinase
MLLCLDAGNTRLKWGLHDGTQWCAQGACALDALPGLPPALPAAPARVLACNVAGTRIATAIETLATALDAPLDWFHSGTDCAGVTNGYADPARLGADRWAALVGARGLHPGGAVVVMAGTATTIDALAADGRFRGGLILPGLDLMRRALAANTANLPAAQGRHAGFPTNTDDAIASGCIEATVGAIERMTARLRERAAGVDFPVFLSGGAAELLAPHLTPPPRRVANLVLEGLARAAAARGLL